MSTAEVKDYTQFVLPSTVVSKADIARLILGFETVDNALTAKTVRAKAGAQSEATPAMSPQLQAFLDLNPVELENTGARSAYIKQLRLLKDKVRIMNMTFAVVADPESLQQLIVWLRESVYPQTVIEAHLQPGLVAGVYLRTPNHVFDLSVRNRLKSKRGELEKVLGSLRG
ncbi:MAG: F0F1 ATP synthase subunit delta [Candidatus Saccharimonadaceae bacterium]